MHLENAFDELRTPILRFEERYCRRQERLMACGVMVEGLAGSLLVAPGWHFGSTLSASTSEPCEKCSS